jgi:hypothetical protein
MWTSSASSGQLRTSLPYFLKISLVDPDPHLFGSPGFGIRIGNVDLDVNVPIVSNEPKDLENHFFFWAS